MVHSRPDPRFERRGVDLWRLETIPVPDAVLGTTQQVPTLEGNAVVTIPPGTQPDTVLRLRGKGLPVFEGKQRGDLHIVVRVWIADQLSAKERKLYERLRALSSKA
jgi:molecular chaperone DnaJ